MLNTQSVEAYLHEHIPLSNAMAVTVRSLDVDQVVLSAPLLPNINHRGTAFGGSISTLATLAAWTYVYVRLKSLSMSCRIVIQSHSIEYLKPIEEDLVARCFAPPEKDWLLFVKMLEQRGKGRINLQAEIYGGNDVAGRFQGKYVAINLD